MQKRAFTYFIASAAVASALLTAPAPAATLYFAQYAGDPGPNADPTKGTQDAIGNTIVQGSTPLSFRFGGVGAGTEIGSGYLIDATAVPDNNGTVHSAVGSSLNAGAYLYTKVSYTFQVVGPAPIVSNATVPLQVIASGWATSAGSGYAIGTFNIGGLGVRSGPLGPSASGAYGASNSFAIDTIIDVYPNVNITVNLTADAYARYVDSSLDPRGLDPNGGAAEAFVDPQFILPPEYAGTYEIVGLPSVPVPPAAWLFGSALGLLGLRRRQA